MSKYVFLGSFPDSVRHSRLGWWRLPVDRWWLDKLQQPLEQQVASLFAESDGVPCVVSGVLKVVAGASGSALVHGSYMPTSINCLCHQSMGCCLSMTDRVAMLSDGAMVGLSVTQCCKISVHLATLQRCFAAGYTASRRACIPMWLKRPSDLHLPYMCTCSRAQLKVGFASCAGQASL